MAPTYKYLEEVWRQLRVVLGPVVIDKSEQQHRLALHGGGSVECWSIGTNTDTGRGRKYRRLVVDEAALVHNLETVWQASLRPTLSVLGGDAWFLSTPKGLDAFHHLYQLGQDPLQTEWKSWQLPSSASPYITDAEIEAARRKSQERIFAQEYLAEFVQIEGFGVFRGVHAVSRFPQRGPERGHQYVMGVGLGPHQRLHRDQRAQRRPGRAGRTGPVLRHRLRVPVGTPASVGGVVQTCTDRRGGQLDGRAARRTSADRLRPLARASATIPADLRVDRDECQQAAVIQALGLAMEQGSITLLDDQVQRGELMAFESSVTVTGMVRYSAPQGLHDDTVMALWRWRTLARPRLRGLRARATRSQHAGSAYVLSRC